MSRKRNGNGRGKRDNSNITNDPLSLLSTSPIWREIEDRRTFSPSGEFRTPLTFLGLKSTLKVAPQKRPSLYASPFVSFDNSPQVVMCARRKRRREVIFAGGNGGRRGRKGRYRRGRYSDIHCS